MVIITNGPNPRNLLEMEEPIPWENPQVVWTHPEGAYSVVLCDTQWDYALETYFLAHCLGTKDYREFSDAHVVYSIRDQFGIPHATILCQRNGKLSPYGTCYDLGTAEYFRPHHRGTPKLESPMRVLQVRGRNDDLAMLPYLELAQQWFVAMGGNPKIPFRKWNQAVYRHMDTDFEYHFCYLLDESNNKFEWTHRSAEQRRQAILDGTSL